MVDERTWECVAIEVHTSLPAERVVHVLEQLEAERGVPTQLRMDNGLPIEVNHFQTKSSIRSTLMSLLFNWCLLPCSNKNIAYHDIQVSFIEGTKGLNIALLKFEGVEHYLLGRSMRLNGPAWLTSLEKPHDNHGNLHYSKRLNVRHALVLQQPQCMLFALHLPNHHWFWYTVHICI